MVNNDTFFDDSGITENNDIAQPIGIIEKKSADNTTTTTTTKASSRDLDILQLYLREIDAYALLSAEEEVYYGGLVFSTIESEQAEGREMMVKSNLRLVVKIARRYLNRGMALADLIEEGNMGLMHAVEKFDVERGHRFSTYATWWIRQNIERALMNQTRTIRLPIHINKELNAFIRKSRELTKQLGREPARAEVAEALGKSLDDLNRLMSYNEKVGSLDVPIGKEGESQLVDFVPIESPDAPNEKLEDRDRIDSISSFLDMLPARHQEVVCRRFGLRGYDPTTLERVGDLMGLTRERVRQIQMDAINKMRRCMENEGFYSEAFLD